MLLKALSFSSALTCAQLQNFKERNLSKYVVSQVFKIGKKQMFVLIFFFQTIALNFE